MPGKHIITPHAQHDRGKMIRVGVHIIGERAKRVTHSQVCSIENRDIKECGSTLYVGLARAVPPTNTNFQLTFLLTRLQEALYEDLPV